MAAVEREKIITDDALKAPLVLAGNFDALYKSIESVLNLVKQFGEAGSNGGGIPKLKTDTEGLTQAQVELIKIQNQVATQAARNNDSYREQQQILGDLKTEMKNTAAQQDVKKNFDAQYASLTDLEKALKSNQVAWAALRGEDQRKSATGLQLKETITKQYEAVQRLRGEVLLHVEDNNKWKESLERALPALSKIAPEAVEGGEALLGLGSKFLTLLVNPITLGLAAIAAGFAFVKSSIDNYTESTVSGADKAEQWGLAWSTATEMVSSRMRDIGRSIVEYIGGEGIMATLIKGLISQLPNGIALLTEYNLRLQANTNILKAQQDLRKEEIVLSVESAELELQTQEKLYEARDKVTKTMETRYEALKEANKLIGEEIALKQKSANAEIAIAAAFFKKRGITVDANTEVKKLFESEKATQNSGYEMIEKLAAAQVKLTNVEKERYEGARRRQALLNSLIDEQVNIELAHEEQLLKAKRLGYANAAQEDLNAANLIIRNQQYTFDEQKAAQEKQTAALIQLDEAKTFEELDALKKSSLGRIQLDQATLDSIYSNENASLEELAATEIAAKEKQLEKDKTYNKERNQVLQTHILAQKQIVLKGVNEIGNIYETYYKNLAAGEDTTNAIDAAKLEERYYNGEISYLEYTAMRKRSDTEYKISQGETLLQQLRQELEYYDSLEKLTGEQEQKVIDLKKQYAQAELNVDREKNAEKLRIDAEVRQKTLELQQELFNGVAQIVNSSLDNQTQALQQNLSNIKAQEQNALTEAGNNAKAKNAITKRYAQIENDTQREIAQKQTEKAIFDKVISAAQVAIKTAEAVAAQLPGLPYTAPLISLIEGIGAAEEAVILATPIPHYAKGTGYARKGLSVVNDGGGSELIQDGATGKFFMYDVPGAVLTYLNEGSKVFTAEQTRNMGVSAFSSSMRIDKPASSIMVDLTPMNKKIDELNKTLKNKKMEVSVSIRTESSFEKMAKYRYR